MVSLQEYVTDQKNKKAKGSCRTCFLPPAILEEIHHGRAEAGIGSKFTLRWLSEVHGITLTRGTLDYHFGEKHHVQQ